MNVKTRIALLHLMEKEKNNPAFFKEMDVKTGMKRMNPKIKEQSLDSDTHKEELGC